MGELAKATGHWVDSIHYRSTAKAYVQEWYQLALTAKDPLHPHAKLAYQDDNSHGLLCASKSRVLFESSTDELALVADNLFGDRVLNLDLFDHQLYEWQSAWYTRKRERFGVPLDSRHLWTKVCTLDSRDSAPSNKVDPVDRLGGTSISDRLRSAIDSFSGLQCFAAASATDVKARDMFIDALVDYLKAGRVDAAFPE